VLVEGHQVVFNADLMQQATALAYSSQMTASTCLRISKARWVISFGLPMGVATM